MVPPQFSSLHALHPCHAGFLIYVSDSFGYLGSVGVMLYKNFGTRDLSWLSFFTTFGHVIGWGTAVIFTVSACYFWLRLLRPAGKAVPQA